MQNPATCSYLPIYEDGRRTVLLADWLFQMPALIGNTKILEERRGVEE